MFYEFLKLTIFLNVDKKQLYSKSKSSIKQCQKLMFLIKTKKLINSKFEKIIIN